MAIEEAPQTTLRDVVAEQFDAIIPDADNPPASTPETVPLPSAAPASETAEAKEARERDEKGRFTAKTEPAAAPDKTATTPPTASAVPTPAPAAEPVKPLARPSSWKKEMWPLWDKLANGVPLDAKEARQVAEYNLQRETEAAKGVSTYKQWADRVKPLADAFEPHRADFEKWGIDPGQQFSKYVEIHKGLALGSEDQKLGMLMRLAQDYKVPIEKMFVQQNGQIFFNPQVQPVAPQAAQPQFNPQNIERTVQAVIAKERTAAEIAAMSTDAVKYPHFETVRETMAQLLDAGIATDLPGAYEAALALPQHRELQQAALTQAQAADEAARKAKQAAEAQRARAAAVSPRSATPASGPAQARKGLRETLAEQFDAVGSGRV